MVSISIRIKRMAKPYVIIVILNWNNAPDTIACLQSVYKLKYSNYSVLVVDNGSEDDSVEQLRLCYPNLDILELESNLGFAEGNNSGMRQALSCGADYVLILNNDTLVHPNMLFELIKVAHANPKTGMVGPKMFCTDQLDMLFAAGSFVDWKTGNLNHRGIFEPDDLYKGIIDSEPVDFIVGCGVLIRKQLIETVGGFNPAYYLNFEDVELGIEAWRSGFQVWFVPRAVMWHKVSATLGMASPANTYYMTRNTLLFFWRNTSLINRWVVLRIMLRTIRTIGAWTIKTKYRNSDYHKRRKANIMAIRDFIFGKFGEMGNDVFLACCDMRE
jgi:GT2 family glycosyltransferase